MADRPRASSARWVPLVYLVLALAVAGPLLASGLVLTLDLVQTPHPGIPETYWGLPEASHVGPPARLPLDALFAGLGTIGAVELGQKLLLLAVVFLAGWGMHRLVPARTREAAFFAGLLYAINPFVYDRLLTGQWFLLLGYALIPHAYKCFLETLEGRRLAPWGFGALFVATGAASTHMAILLLAICAATLVAWGGRIRRRPALLRAPLKGLALGLLPSLYWLLPTPGVEDLWRHIGPEQLELYRTVGDQRWGLAPAVAGMFGYWNNELPLKAYVGVWPLFALTLLVLSAWGVALRRRDPTTWAVVAIGIGGFLLALGTASGLTRGAFDTLLDHLPALRSFRESQKGVALLVFAYAFLSVGAVDALLAKPPKLRWGKPLLAAVLLALPLMYGYRLFGGLFGELQTSEFPRSWSEARESLEDESPRSRTLFLPWHGYLVLNFAHDRVVGNPAASFFDTPVLSSRSIGEGADRADEADPTEQFVRRQLDRAERTGQLRAACLAPLGVTHILLAKTADWRRYGFLDHSRDLIPVERWPDLVLYRSRLPAGPVMAGPGARESGAPLACRSDLEPLPSRRRSPVRYRVGAEVPAGESAVLGLPLYDQWRVEPGEVSFEPWGVYRRNYLLGLAGAALFAVSLVVVLRRRR